MHIADWGKPHTWLMRIAVLSLKSVRAERPGEANLQGRLLELCARAGFYAVTQTLNMSTTFGTVTLLFVRRAAAPGGEGSGNLDQNR